MNEDKHTPEPWAYYDDRKSTGRIEIVGLGKTVSRIYLSVPDEDVANARHIVACVNACAGLTTAELELAAAFGERLQAKLVGAKYKQQRDELLEHIENLLFWDNGKPEFDDARAAIAGVKEKQKGN